MIGRARPTVDYLRPRAARHCSGDSDSAAKTIRGLTCMTALGIKALVQKFGTSPGLKRSTDRGTCRCSLIRRLTKSRAPFETASYAHRSRSLISWTSGKYSKLRGRSSAAPAVIEVDVGGVFLDDIQPQSPGGRNKVRTGVEAHDLAAEVGNLLRQHAIAATHVQDVFAGSWGEQFEDRRTEVGDEACVLGVAL